MLPPYAVEFYYLVFDPDPVSKIEYAVACIKLLFALLVKSFDQSGYWYAAHPTWISDFGCNLDCFESIRLFVVDESPDDRDGTRSDEPRNCGWVANRKSAITADFR
jgi:hypothetical protein